MRLADRVFTFFDIQPAEKRPVALMLAFSFCLGVTISALSAVTNALFLETFGSAGLPGLYIAIAIVVGLSSFIYLKVGERLSFEWLSRLVLIFSLVWLLLSWAGLWLARSRWLLFSLPLILPVVGGLGSLIFWALAGRLFDIRQGKRLNGLIGSGRWLAAVVLGSAVPLLVRFIGTENLMLVAVAGVAGLLVLVNLSAQGSSAEISSARGDEPAQSADGAWREGRYLVMLSSLMFASSVAYYLAEFSFNDRVVARFLDAAQLASFLGVFSAVQGLLALVLAATVSGPFIARFGVLIGVVFQPGVLALMAGGMWVFASVQGIEGLFWFAVINYFTMTVLNSAIDRSAVTILYQPMPVAARTRAFAVVDGIVQPISMGVIGLGLLLLTTLGVTLYGLVFALVIAALAWVGVAWRLGKVEYPRMLQKALARRALDGLNAGLTDAASVALLKAGLKHPHPAAVLYALHTLEDCDPAAAAAALPDLLKHPADQVRLEVWRGVERLKPAGLAGEALAELLQERSADVLGVALRGLAAIDENQGFNQALSYLHSGQPAVRLGAVVTLVRYGGIEGVLAAGQVLLQLAASSDSAERALAARALGEIGVKTFYQPLVPLLCDDALDVRRVALRSAGKLRSRELWPLVVDALNDVRTRRPAQLALADAGPIAWDTLQSSFQWEHQPPEVLCRLVAAAGQVGGKGVVALLAQHVDIENGIVRGEILRQLFHLDYHPSASERALLRQQLEGEAQHAAWLLAAWSDTGDGPNRMLRSACVNSLSLLRLRVLYLLSFLYESQSIRRVRFNLVFGSASQRAVALEVIETLVGREVSALVLPILDTLPLDVAFGRLNGLFPQERLGRAKRLEMLLTQAGHRLMPWMGACALYTVGQEHLEELSTSIQAFFDSDNDLLREMAAWASCHLGELPPDIQRKVAQDAAPAVRAVLLCGEKKMLSTVEKVIFLKTVNSFAAMPDDALADVALLLDEQEVRAGERIIEQGQVGESMYIVVDGRVRVHTGETTLNYLTDGAVFGELAVLASEPRSASVTAAEDSLLLRLEQYELYELLEYRTEVASGIIQVLTQHLRERTRELADLRSVRESTTVAG
jgi:HEAT repeat protein/ATP/ADP translocase